ncbi:MAG: lysophospholipid acyltransferase family protein [Clostridiales bacterium]|nr:lysophospholipid acyltransferase family protein [Clostridiales bacterium]
MFYRFAAGLVRFLFLFCFRVRIVGKENIPSQGAVILALNHRSYFDPVFAGAYCPRKLRFMAKAELFKNKAFGALIRSLGAFPVKRGRGDIGAVKSAFEVLKNDDMLLIFPHGKRVRDNSKGRIHSGAAMIAVKMQCPIIPAWISGDYKWMNKITVSFGEPVSFEEYYSKKLTGEELQTLADGLLDKMYALKVED